MLGDLGLSGLLVCTQWNSSENRPMSKNLILEELYAVRSEIQAEHGDHLSAYLHGEFERLKAAGHPVAQLKQQTIRCTEAVKPSAPAVASRALPPGRQ
jgi:hypothetical protein